MNRRGHVPVLLLLAGLPALLFCTAPSTTGRLDAGHPDAGVPEMDSGTALIDAGPQDMDAGDTDAGAPDAGADDAGPALQEWTVYRYNQENTAFVDVPLTTVQAQTFTNVWTYQHEDVSDSNPIVSQGIAYFAWDSGTLRAVDMQTGTELWARYAGFVNPSTCAPIHAGPIGAPAVVGDRVIQPGGDGTVYAFDRVSGTLLWSTNIANVPGNEFLWSSAFPLHGKIYIGVSTLYEPLCGPVPGRLVVLDEATGAKVGEWWANPNHSDGGGVWTQPAYDARTNRLFMATGTVDNGVDPVTQPYAQAIVALDADTLAVVDSFQAVPAAYALEFDFGTSPTLFDLPSGQHMIASANKDGFVYALDRDHLSDGIVWRTEISGPGASPDDGEGTIVSAAYAHGLLFVGGGATTDGYPGAIAALDPATGAKRWLIHTDGFVLAGLMAVGDVVIGGATRKADFTGRIYVLNQETGEGAFTFDTAGALFAPATFAEGTLLVPDGSGRVYAFRTNP